MDTTILPTNRGIYLIRRFNSDDCYVGSAVDIARRWNAHRSMLTKGAHHSRHMQNVYNKHGESSLEFSVLEYVEDKANLIAREQAWIDAIRPAFNTCPVAGSSLGRVVSAAHSAALSEANRKRKHSAETLAKMSVSISKVKSTPESRAHMSAALKGRKHTPEQRAAHMGRTHTPESLAKMSAAKMGKKHLPEARAKMSASQKLRWARAKESIVELPTS